MSDMMDEDGKLASPLSAKEAYFLLNESIRNLWTIEFIFQKTKEMELEIPLNMPRIAAVRNLIVSSTVIYIYRLYEIQSYFLPFILSQTELTTIGFAPIEDFVGRSAWPDLVCLRNQYFGHVTKEKPYKGMKGSILPPGKLSAAVKNTGLADLESFLARIQTDLVPLVDRLRGKLSEKYPDVKYYLLQHGLDVDEGLHK